MVFWLYQMAVMWFKPEAYRKMVWEGKRTTWTAGKIATKKRPAPGDRMVLWFAKAGNEEPGIYGWGVILKYNAHSNKVDFRPAPPSDFLKMYPLCDDEVERTIGKIRKVPRGTMWLVEEEYAKVLRKKIHNWAK